MTPCLARCSAVVFLLATVAAADDLPQMEELQKLKADKNWTELLKSTTRVLALKGAAAEPYDRAQVWILKAEAQLQSAQFIPASQSYESASEEKGVAAEVADMCTALSLVMKKSDVRGYHPPVTKENPQPQSIDIKDPEKRKDAVVALFNGEYAEGQRDLAKAKQKPALPELVKLARQTAALPQIERAAFKTEEKSKQLMVDISTLAADTIDKWAKAGETEVDKIKQNANEMVQVEVRNSRNPDRRETAMRKRGLTSKDKTDLQDVIKGCERVASTYKQFVEAAGEATGALKDVTVHVEQLYASAKEVLNDDYSGDRPRMR